MPELERKGSALNPDRWEKISRVYHAALARREEERAVFLSDACAGDNAIRREVEALLACDTAAERFLEPAMEVAARMMKGAHTEDSLVGRQIGVYRITSLLGAGGMGEVYRAYDTKLNREVALKVLPDLFAAAPERLKRFQREAQALAALNHPSIAHIHGFEEADGVPALVMELVDGDELGELMAHGPMPLQDVLPIARQIAEALEEAHQHGIIHRDLKPANIKVRDDGAVKVLDFGLAKAFDPKSASGANLPTHDADATEMGLILGTAHYMAPEQAVGKPIDKRVDVWAFGVVLYEMLTGRRAFDGEDVSGILAAVLKDTPSWAMLPAETPSSIRRLLHRCLEKDRRERLGDMSAVRLDIKDALAGDPTSAGAKVPTAVGTGHRLAWAAALLAITVLSGLLSILYFRTPPEQPEMRLEISTSSSANAFSFALSPDGRRLAFVADDAGESRLWVRRLDDPMRAEPLAGTEEATYPFWSPDSQSIAFFAGGWLKRFDIGTGLSRQLASVFAPRGGSWSADGVILYAPTVLGPLWQVADSGGAHAPVTRLESPDKGAHLFPQFLPDGRRFLFFVRGNPDDQGIHLGSLGSEKTTRLTAAATAGAYLAPGWLLFVQDGALVARRFDSSRGELSGDPLTVANPVGFHPGMHAGAFSTAAGAVIYRASVGLEKRQLNWFDRSGTPLGTIGAADDSLLEWPALSPDGQRVAVSRQVQGNRHIWVLDGVRQVLLTSDGSRNTGPIWSPDGKWIAFSSYRKGSFDLYRKRSDGVGSEELLLVSPYHKNATGWSRDDQILYSVDNDPKTGYDLWSLPLEQGVAGTPKVLLNESYEERGAQFSPDQRFMAYVSNESGQHEIYVRPFPGPGASSLVSTTGGITPRWNHDGKELYYIAPDSMLMAAPIGVKDGTVTRGTPVPLFQTRIVGGGRAYPIIHQYDVTRDGRFLINVRVGDTPASPLTLLLNWKPPGE